MNPIPYYFHTDVTVYLFSHGFTQIYTDYFYKPHYAQGCDAAKSVLIRAYPCAKNISVRVHTGLFRFISVYTFLVARSVTAPYLHGECRELALVKRDMEDGTSRRLRMCGRGLSRFSFYSAAAVHGDGHKRTYNVILNISADTR